MSPLEGQPAAPQAERFGSPQPESPAAKFDADFARRALDGLFVATKRYATGRTFGELFQFLCRFRFYSPFNAMLLHIQNPGTTYAAPAERWKQDFDRVIRPGARPLVILQPMGPVMFVFDVGDTEPTGPDTRPLPREVTAPFEPRGCNAECEFRRVRHNAVRDGVLIAEHPEGLDSAGRIVPTKTKGLNLAFSDKVFVPRRYDIVLNSKHSVTARFTTLVHEMAHLYSGHLGKPFEECKWWPDRRGMDVNTMEFEAESVTFVVCTRQGIQPPSATYLAEYLGQDKALPRISLERVLVAAGLIETMCKGSLPPNRPPKRQ